MNFGGMTFTADPLPGETDIRWYRVHSIQFELELFGCDTYDINEGRKLLFSLLVRFK
jgi:hypothetical protein